MLRTAPRKAPRSRSRSSSPPPSLSASTTTPYRASTPKLTPQVQKQLDALTRAEISLQTQITELAESAGPHMELLAMNDRIRAELKGINRGVENLRFLAEEEDRPSDAELIREKAAQHEEQYKRLQLSLRRSNLQAKANIDRAAAAEREELLKGGTDRRQLRMRKMADAAATAQASSELTDSLRQALGMMTAEVQKGVEITKAFDDSTKIMQKTSAEYRSLSMVIRSSRQLITKLQQRDWTDRLLLLFGLLVFSLTVLSILRRRLWIWVPGWKLVTGQCNGDEWFCF
ncbi:uncharacterized protein EV422DRAFT_368249 [Fimicolochytrium jonesii]|uniref:uncharacterized protein n=1 Tax=Fimicolochytrium jonesii TaxID=1396493 RepID=UPI0022FE96AD|nr:uncharacterized protein EV422DRAFT_368249 [Fimicolochytrium jonesii]KAI8823738.1 hypothetical protein EV422DRAFT_368249 [Fimicolochytrium jonesii]